MAGGRFETSAFARSGGGPLRRQAGDGFTHQAGILAHKHCPEEHRRQLHSTVAERRYFSAESMMRLRGPLSTASDQELLVAIG